MVMATIAPFAASMGLPWRQTPAVAGVAIERWLEAERDQLALWLPIALGVGVTAWFVLPDPRGWTAVLLAVLSLGLGALAIGRYGRLARAVGVGALAAALGLTLVWWRAERVAAPVLGGPTVARITATVERVEPLAARGLVRLTVLPASGATDDRGGAVRLPPRVRINLQAEDAPAGLGAGAVVRLRARLMPPPVAAVPGAHDYARQAWFDGIGGTGRGFAPVTVVRPGAVGGGLRAALSQHITTQLPGSEGGIAAALATGDVGAIGQEDSDAMRRAGAGASAVGQRAAHHGGGGGDDVRDAAAVGVEFVAGAAHAAPAVGGHRRSGGGDRLYRADGVAGADDPIVRGGAAGAWCAGAGA